MINVTVATLVNIVYLHMIRDYNSQCCDKRNGCYPDKEFVESNEFSCAIVVIGEHPYAEWHGDNMNLTIPNPGPETITNVRK